MSTASGQAVQAAYQAELAARGFASDPAQQRAVQALQTCADAWGAYRQKRSNSFKKLLNRPEVPPGVYMYGGVGRGKSFLMDCFYQAVPIRRKTRLHFHEFMREVHREMLRLQGFPDDFKIVCNDGQTRKQAGNAVPVSMIHAVLEEVLHAIA